jgi:hypothetical protein
MQVYASLSLFYMNRQSDLNRTKRAESLRKVADNLRDVPRGMPSPRGGEIALKTLVEEVIKYLMEII